MSPRRHLLRIQPGRSQRVHISLQNTWSKWTLICGIIWIREKTSQSCWGNAEKMQSFNHRDARAHFASTVFWQTLSAAFIANLWCSLSDAEHTKKIGAIIIYLDILFTRDHFPTWLGTEGGGGIRGRREGGPQGFGDSWQRERQWEMEGDKERRSQDQRQCDEQCLKWWEVLRPEFIQRFCIKYIREIKFLDTSPKVWHQNTELLLKVSSYLCDVNVYRAVANKLTAYWHYQPADDQYVEYMTEIMDDKRKEYHWSVPQVLIDHN